MLILTACKLHATSGYRLRSELEVFDLEFFEELEDLKYSYAELQRKTHGVTDREVSLLRLERLHLLETK